MFTIIIYPDNHAAITTNWGNKKVLFPINWLLYIFLYILVEMIEGT